MSRTGWRTPSPGKGVGTCRPITIPPTRLSRRAYAVAGQVRGYMPPDYHADHGMVPHGMSVIVSAPAVARFTASAAPDKHRRIAMLLGAERTRHDDEVGDALAEALARLMRVTGMPNGLR